ncbi:AraC family transcriptional regulator ligand-binding domain-containing protein [Olivibacter sp. SDN3]|uniref:AraC family transcriptional regulator n=1 Tax=Olivibacter sp. SDN3 TaxID=2764720 RepID=UPI0016513471|nr:AraC family transcriptional regulator [Olivibacter sp. SDN3]QNL51863.1 AraC family transcriptional regulator ligand-binding domain-containing protein [Olivibacter sp. SDN3]
MNYRRTFLQALLLFCGERNIDPQRITSLSGISLRELNTKTKFNLTNQQLENVWKNIVQLSGDELIGLHFGATMQIAALNTIGQIIQTSNTVKEALQHACSLVHLITDFYTIQIEEKTKTFTITFQKNDGFDNFPTARNQMGDFLITFTLYELKGLVLENPKPIKASLLTYKKIYDREYQNILKCSTKKNDNYSLEFKKDYLKTKIITANYEIQNLLIEQINKLQNPTSLNGGFSKKIFNFLIANSYLYSLSIESVAGNFNLSVRTLQRKLKEEGVSYLQIVEEVRKSLAIHYIQNSTSSIKEISSILGYAEPSGFVRAFKKWTGKTPSEYRHKYK